MSNCLEEQELINDFELYFPLVAKHVFSYKLKSYGLLEIVLDDDSKLVYDWYDKSILNLKDNLDDISEEAWRKHFRYKLVKLLRQRHMPQKVLSELTGISERTLTKYTNGSATPSSYNIRKIARSLKVDINELIDI